MIFILYFFKMNSKHYNAILEDFILKSETYMDFYLSYYLIKNNISEYLNPKKFKISKLEILDKYYDSDESSSNEDMAIEIDDTEKLSRIIDNFINELNIFYSFDKNSKNIKEDIFQILMSSTIEEKNRCVECGTDMGRCNPRQLCGKIYCYNQ
jgi:hypothetical protein